MKLGWIGLMSFMWMIAACTVSNDQKRVTGNGTVIVESRSAASFGKIDAEGDFMIIYKKSSISSISVSADENLMPYIETTVDGGTLKIKAKSGYLPVGSTTLIVRVSSPAVSDLSLLGSGLLSADTLTGTNFASDLNGSGAIAIRYAKGDKMVSTLLGAGSQEIGGQWNYVDCNLEGQGNYDLTGKSSNLKLVVDGSGTISAYPLITSQANVNIIGAARCYISVNQSLSVKIDGSGKVLYKGTASQIDKTITGDGSVTAVN